MTSLDGIISGSKGRDYLAAKPYFGLYERIISPMKGVYNTLKGAAEYTKRTGYATIDRLVSVYNARKKDSTLLPFDYSTAMNYDSLSDKVYNRLQDVWGSASERVRNLINHYSGLSVSRFTKNNPGSSRYKPNGFTLQELLVVIAVTGTLMAILMSALYRVRKQAKSTVCQANLHEWGLTFEAYKLFDFQDSLRVHEDDEERPWWLMGGRRQYYYGDKKNPMLCPMAVKLPFKSSSLGPSSWHGRKFSPWGYEDRQDWQDKDWRIIAGSYGINQFFGYQWKNPPPYYLVPLLLDGLDSDVGLITSLNRPPEKDDIYVLTQPASHFCVNRHDGGINMLFMDYSTRKVGLKELWTLKWHKRFDTAGLWTKAGGVQPGDWPKWMRRFKDY